MLFTYFVEFRELLLEDFVELVEFGAVLVVTTGDRFLADQFCQSFCICSGAVVFFLDQVLYLNSFRQMRRERKNSS